MIYLTGPDEQQPVYATRGAAGADVMCAEDTTLPGGEFRTILVPTGVRIAGVDLDAIAGSGGVLLPELQLRGRSSLAREGIILATGVGTIDMDYRDEIHVPLLNLSDRDVTLRKGERIAQLIMSLVPRIPGIPVVDSERAGGFGSTDDRDNIPIIGGSDGDANTK